MKNQLISVAQRVSRQPGLAGAEAAALLALLSAAGAGEVLRTDIRGWSISDPAVAAADPEINLLGEFAGTRTKADGSTEPVSASVGALGGGAYRILVRDGGLPGSGQERPYPELPAVMPIGPDGKAVRLANLCNAKWGRDVEAFGKRSADGRIAFIVCPDTVLAWDYDPADGGALKPRPPQDKARGQAWGVLVRTAPAPAGEPPECGEFASPDGSKPMYRARLRPHVGDWFRLVVDVDGKWGGLDGAESAYRFREAMVPGTELFGLRSGDRVDAVGVVRNLKATVSVVGDDLSGVDGEGRTFNLRRVERSSPTLGAKPPPGAVVLFDGSGTEAWKAQHGRKGIAIKEIGGSPALPQGVVSVQSFAGQTLHLEFYLLMQPLRRRHFRSNSGVFLNGHWEVTIGDSFGYRSERYNWAAGGLYQTAAPSVNAALPPFRWQTYDVEVDLKGGTATISVRHNGVATVERKSVKNSTVHGTSNEKGDGSGALILEGFSGGGVWFRNIWLVERPPAP